MVSLTGSGAATFALGMAVFAATGQAAALALVLAAKFVTGIYLAPLAGAVAELSEAPAATPAPASEGVKTPAIPPDADR